MKPDMEDERREKGEGRREKGGGRTEQTTDDGVWRSEIGSRTLSRDE
jgi:hypothetical protein